MDGQERSLGMCQGLIGVVTGLETYADHVLGHWEQVQQDIKIHENTVIRRMGSGMSRPGIEPRTQ